MKLDYGFTEYDTEKAKPIFSWKSLLDYDPNSSSLELAVGDHYTIYKDAKNGYFLHCRQRIQRSFAGEVADGQEYIEPITGEMVCVYAILHNNPQLIESEGLQSYQKSITERVLSIGAGETPKVSKSKREVFLDLESLATQVSEKKLPFAEDIKYDLHELQQCLGIAAYRASLAISGRILELCLKLYCVNNGVEFSDNWMVGQLIDKIGQSGKYLDPSLKSIWQIINQQRIIGVHAKAQAPIPSREQAFMVSFAVIDTLKRLLQN